MWKIIQYLRKYSIHSIEDTGTGAGILRSSFEIIETVTEKPDPIGLVFLSNYKGGNVYGACLVSPSVAIHIVAHLCNLERYHLSRSAETEGLRAALSQLGDAPNESYLNPIRAFHAVSSPCLLPPFPSEKAFLFQSL